MAPFPSSAGWRTAMLLVALSAIAFMALSRRLDWGLHEVPRAFALAAAAWIALAVVSLAWSDKPAYTLEELQREVLYSVFAFVALFSFTRTPRHGHVAIVAMLSGTLLLGVFEWARHFMPWLPYAERYHGIQGPFSTHIALVAPMLALVAWPRPVGMGARPVVVAAVAAGLVLSGLATENRMLWIALAAGAVTAFAVFQAGSTLDAHRARMLRVLLGALALIAIAIAASWEYKVARYYPKAATTVESISLDERPRVWAAAFPMLLERPLGGHGYGREIVGDRIERAVPRHDDVHLRHAHNVFGDVALQLGILGIAAFAAMLAALARNYGAARHAPACAPLAIAGLSLLATFVVKNLTDDHFFRPNSLTFWAINGMLLGLCARGAKEPG